MTESIKRIDLDALELHLDDHALRAPFSAALVALIAEVRTSRTVLAAINDIRNSIVGYQRVNWSAHIYPLVAALEEAGIHGEGYDVASGRAKTQVQRIAELEAALEEIAQAPDGDSDAPQVLQDHWDIANAALRLTESATTHKGNE